MISISVKLSGFPTEEGLESLAEEQIKAKIKAAYDYAVDHSPVYSGAYRLSWRVAFNTPDDSVSDGFPGNPPPPRKFVWPPGFKLGYTIIISNNQPYAERLENGWSEQAPLGIARLAALKLT